MTRDCVTSIGQVLSPDPERTATVRRDLGLAIRARRFRVGLTMSEVSRVAGVTRGYLNGVEHGRYLLTIPLVNAIAKALGTTGRALLREVLRDNPAV